MKGALANGWCAASAAAADGTRTWDLCSAIGGSRSRGDGRSEMRTGVIRVSTEPGLRRRGACPWKCGPVLACRADARSCQSLVTDNRKARPLCNEATGATALQAGSSVDCVGANRRTGLQRRHALTTAGSVTIGQVTRARARRPGPRAAGPVGGGSRSDLTTADCLARRACGTSTPC